MLRVLVVDDSPVARSLLTEILNGESDIQVVAEAVNGADAVDKVKELQPDIVTMDVQMPRMDGYAATREIMVTCPTPIVVVSGSTGHADVEKSMQALEAGALTVIGKPLSPNSEAFEQSASLLVNTVRSMAAVRVIRRHRPRVTTDPTAVHTAAVAPRHDTPVSALKPRLITIAASTGGPQALRVVLQALPVDFPIPVIVVQHISPGFTEGLADWLQRSVEIDVGVAKRGTVLQPGHVYFAPEGAHCGVNSNGTLEAPELPPIGGFRPSATVLFESASRVYGGSHIAVILTGMGSDGVDGLRSVRQTHGFVIAQDEASSVVYGMPKAAADAGLADGVLSLTCIGPELVRLSSHDGKPQFT